MLHSALEEAGVDCSHCGFHADLSSGRGYVFLQAQTGSVSAVVSGGSNALGWTEWEHAWEERQKRIGSFSPSQSRSDLEDRLERILEEEGVRCVLLQREVPECVNLLIASCVEDYNNNRESDDKIEVFQDLGGEDRPMSKQMMELCDYIVPNESELKRLVKSSSPSILPLPAKDSATEKAISAEKKRRSICTSAVPPVAPIPQKEKRGLNTRLAPPPITHVHAFMLSSLKAL